MVQNATKPKRKKAKSDDEGRPTVLTPEVQDKIVKAIRGGNYIETAAALAGINKKQLYDWLKWGAKSDAPKRHDIYRKFSNAVCEALAFSEARDVQGVDKHAHGTPERVKEYRDAEGNLVREITPGIDPDWRAAAWRLERRFHHRWGRRESIKVFDADEGEAFGGESSHTQLMDLIEGKDSES